MLAVHRIVGAEICFAEFLFVFFRELPAAKRRRNVCASLFGVMPTRNVFAAFGEVIAMLGIVALERGDVQSLEFAEFLNRRAFRKNFDVEIVDAVLFDGAPDRIIGVHMFADAPRERSSRLPSVFFAVDPIGERVNHHRFVHDVFGHDIRLRFFIDKPEANTYNHDRRLRLVLGLF